jgi:hypothetical protein
MQFVCAAVDEVGATLNAALVVMGDKLGLYTLPSEQAVALTDESSPAYLPGFVQIAPAAGYSGSSYDLVTMLSRDVGLALGAQAGQARVRDVVETRGFARFRRMAATPFNVVLEVRP